MNRHLQLWGEGAPIPLTQIAFFHAQSAQQHLMQFVASPCPSKIICTSLHMNLRFFHFVAHLILLLIYVNMIWECSQEKLAFLSEKQNIWPFVHGYCHTFGLISDLESAWESWIQPWKKLRDHSSFAFIKHFCMWISIETNLKSL